MRCLTESTVSAHDVEAEKTVWVANSLDMKQSKKFRRETPGGCGGLLAGCRPSVLGSGERRRAGAFAGTVRGCGLVPLSLALCWLGGTWDFARISTYSFFIPQVK